jgi:hypothetical protein
MNTLETSHNDFLTIAQLWQSELTNYSFEDLTKTMNAESWSLGQVYNHLINSALFFHLKQVETCLQSTENSDQHKSERGEMAFGELNGFPPIKISVPPSENYTPKQPESKEVIEAGINRVIAAMTAILPSFDHNKNGKTAHPSFTFLNAEEWYRLIEMHWRHHLNQKQELDTFLKS